jgi:hypothetical protein
MVNCSMTELPSGNLVENTFTLLDLSENAWDSQQPNPLNTAGVVGNSIFRCRYCGITNTQVQPMQSGGWSVVGTLSGFRSVVCKKDENT